jgi:hypothetical protein
MSLDATKQYSERKDIRPVTPCRYREQKMEGDMPTKTDTVEYKVMKEIVSASHRCALANEGTCVH